MAEQFLTPGLWDRDRVQQTLEHAGETVTVRTVERRIEGLPFLPPIVDDRDLVDERGKAVSQLVLSRAAKHRSVAMAVSGAIAKPSMSTGVMSAPPPTPVKPTSVPVRAPTSTRARGSIGATLKGSLRICRILHKLVFV